MNGSVGAVSALTFGIQVFVTLIVIIDPPGVMPIFLSLVSKYSPEQQRRLAWKTASVSLLLIIIFALFGQFILDYLKISLPALQGAGGLLLLLVALNLLTGNQKEQGNEEDGHAEPFDDVVGSEDSQSGVIDCSIQFIIGSH